MQLVLMALRPGEPIGEGVHPDRDQFFRLEKGNGEVWIDGAGTKIESDTAIIVPAGARHNVKNTGDGALKLYTLYAPPQHGDTHGARGRSGRHASGEHVGGRTTE